MSAQNNKNSGKEAISIPKKDLESSTSSLPVPQYLIPGDNKNLPYPSLQGYSVPWLSQGRAPSPTSWGTPWVPVPSQVPATHTWPYIMSSRDETPRSTNEVANTNYMVDSMRRIYNNDTGSIEIERVKVQKKADPRDAAKLNADGSTLVTVPSTALNERRPPPRKNKIKKKILEAAMKTQQPSSTVPIPQPWYPYMPYMPMYPPYPSPYYCGYPLWPGGSPPEHWQINTGSMNSDSTAAMQDSVLNKNRSLTAESETHTSELLSESMKSSDFRNSTSLTEGSHTTDIAPSESVSLGEYNREVSAERDLISPTPSQVTHTHLSEEFPLGEVCKTQEWMLDMQKALLPCSEDDNIPSGGKLESSKQLDNIPKAPMRKNKNKNKLNSSFNESFDETTTESTVDLRAAFKDLQKSVEDFESQVALPPDSSIVINNHLKKEESSVIINPKSLLNNNKQNASLPILSDSNTLDSKQNNDSTYYNIISHEQNRSMATVQPETSQISQNIKSESPTTVIPDQVLRVLESSKSFEQKNGIKFTQPDDLDGRESRASSCSYHSTRPSTDEQLMFIDTDSTDIQSPTGEETVDNVDVTTPAAVITSEDYGWIIQQPGDAPELCSTQSPLSKEDEQRNSWRAEVSLWRAKLVVSLCRGGGLDRQDWATFQLLVLHPLSLDLKLSLLHAPRLCGSNSTIGAGLVRSGLLHLTRYGEILLQPENNRPSGWKSIKVTASQPWAPMKGSVEILRTLGYKPREDGVLRYPRRPATETSILARLTLDMLVLAEELRLYLTGAHQYSSNISKLFFPSSTSIPGSPEPNQSLFHSFSSVPGTPEPPTICQVSNRPSSSASYGFVSAHSSTSADLDKRSIVSDSTGESTDVPELPKKKMLKINDKTKKIVPIKRKGIKRRPAPNPPAETSSEIKTDLVKTEASFEAPSPALVTTHSVSPDISDISSLPDLSTLSSSSSSRQSSQLTSVPSSSSESLTPVASPELQSFNEEKSSSAIDLSLLNNEKTNTPKDKNPDDHVYEEISEIKAQVAALKAKESKTTGTIETPPPLPPKAKLQIPGDDDSELSITYPNIEWSTSSGTGSLRGGSTGARRKKRRAPLPPDFMSSDWINDGKAFSESNIHVSCNSTAPSTSESELCTIKSDHQIERVEIDSSVSENKGCSKQELNPFYDSEEDTETTLKTTNIKDEKQETENTTNISEINDEIEEQSIHTHDLNISKSSNPFDEDITPKGYIGKNPFYEDVEDLKKENAMKATVAKDDEKNENVNTKPITPDISDSQASDIERLKKRELRSPPPDPPCSSTASIVTKVDEAPTKPTCLVTNQTETSSKNGMQEQHLVSRDVVSNNLDNNERKILSDVDDHISYSSRNAEKEETCDEINEFSVNEQHLSKDKFNKIVYTEESNLLRSILTNVMNSEIYIPEDKTDENVSNNGSNNDFDDFDSFQENEATPQTVSLAFNINKDKQSLSLEDIKIKENECQKEDKIGKDNVENSQSQLSSSHTHTVTEVIDICLNNPSGELQDKNNAHIDSNSSQQPNQFAESITNTLNDRSEDIKKILSESIDLIVSSENNNKTKTSNKLPSPISVPKMPEIHQPLSLFDDIPYIDISEAKSSRSNTPKKIEDNSASQYEIPDTTNISPFTNYASDDKIREAKILLQGPPKAMLIDESDIPPEGVPPPPPDTSPPETPHTSPPDSIRNSLSISPVFINFPAITVEESSKTQSTNETIKQQKTHDMKEEIATPANDSILPSINNIKEDLSISLNESIQSEEKVHMKENASNSTQDNVQPESNDKMENVPISTNDIVQPETHIVEKNNSISATEIMPPETHNIKEDILIDAKENVSNKTNDILLNKDMQESLSDDRYEIPEPPSDEVLKEHLNSCHVIPVSSASNNIESLEDRYEIPEVAKQEGNFAETTGKASSTKSWCVSSFTEPKEALLGLRRSLAEACPLKPPRGRRFMGPPPRPPKNFNNDSKYLPPPLPPKGQTSSQNRRSSATNSVSSTPSTIKSRSVASTPTFGFKSTATSPSPTDSKTKSKTLNIKIKRNSKKTRSWPFMLCDCLYVDCYDDVH